jgi:hypothetical protein
LQLVGSGGGGGGGGGGENLAKDECRMEAGQWVNARLFDSSSGIIHYIVEESNFTWKFSHR